VNSTKQNIAISAYSQFVRKMETCLPHRTVGPTKILYSLHDYVHMILLPF